MYWDDNDKLVSGALGLGTNGFAHVLNYLALDINGMNEGNGGDLNGNLTWVDLNINLWFLRGGDEGFLEYMFLLIGSCNMNDARFTLS